MAVWSKHLAANGHSVINSDRTAAAVFGLLRTPWILTLLLSLDAGSRITPQTSRPLNVLDVDFALNMLHPPTSTSNVENYVYMPRWLELVIGQALTRWIIYDR